MRLKKIVLKNIRSYKEETIEFPVGSTLLSGDIGSGKTSILLGIEFALFGLQPGQRGTSLLRNGEKEGSVKIDFEVDNKNVTVERILKRSKNIAQDYCSISVDGLKEEVAVTELKDRVLSLLSYPKEFAKKQNLLYKFTVYTPQEEMKQIILQDSETRINTLRHVFGIDKYKTILDNLTILSTKLREEKKFKTAITESLNQDSLDLVKKEEELEEKNINLLSVEKEFFLKSELRKKAQEDKDLISKKIEEKLKFEREIEKTKLVILNKNDTIKGNMRLKSALSLEIKDLEGVIFDEKKPINIKLEIQELKKKKFDLNEKNLDVTSKISSLTLKNYENDDLKTKLKNLEMCPTCLQDVDPVYKSNVTNKLDSEISTNVRSIEDLAVEKKKIIEEVIKTDYEISIKDKEIQDLQILRMKLDEVAQKKKRLLEMDNLILTLEKDIDLLNFQLDNLKSSVFEFSKFENIYEVKKKEYEESLKIERQVEIKVAELKKEIEVFTRQINELKRRVEKTIEIKKELDYINILEGWVFKEFSTLISVIERNVMIRLKHDFSELFQEWFSMLVSDNFTAKLDDNFTPIITQHDYEIDYNHLSGGERTAVALAYRLALNQVINSLLSKIKTKDFLILDEPTDGFSDQQLDKMREVLDQLNVGQLIIVSHEQKIEGFVENVIKFKKENGVSKKT